MFETVQIVNYEIIFVFWEDSTKHNGLTVYSHGQELFYKLISKITNKLVKQLLSMTVDATTKLQTAFFQKDYN